jgi:hypothetical protein
MLSPGSPDTSRNSGKVYAVGLRDIEDVGIAEAEQYARVVLLGDVLLGFLVLLATNADNRGKDANAFGSCIDAERPRFFHVQKPATRVAVGICRAISSTFPKL